MLVLSRRTNEKIVMPTLGTTIQVVAVKPGVVRIGIQADCNVPVFREEVLARLDPEERARLVPVETDRLREQTRLLSEALNNAAEGMAQLRRQLNLWQREDLGVALDRLTEDLRDAQQAAAGLDPASSVVVTLASSQQPDLIVY
jgi:carbon storage regulator CsrA